MVKNMVKQAVSNPAIHSKLAINVGKKLYWSKDGRKKRPTWSRNRVGLPPSLTRLRAYGMHDDENYDRMKVCKLTIRTCLHRAFQPHLRIFVDTHLLILNKWPSGII